MSATAANTMGGLATAAGWPSLPAEYFVARWYAAYTSANHEKRVAEQLSQREIEHFLPLYASVRRWKDRRVMLQVPLFPGYVFVRIELKDRMRVLQIPGLARLVGFDGTPAALPEDEIEALKKGITAGVRLEPNSFLTVGRRVRVVRGPMIGMEGILLRRRKQTRLVVSVGLIMRSVAVEIDESDIEPRDIRDCRGVASRTEAGQHAAFPAPTGAS